MLNEIEVRKVAYALRWAYRQGYTGALEAAEALCKLHGLSVRDDGDDLTFFVGDRVGDKRQLKGW